MAEEFIPIDSSSDEMDRRIEEDRRVEEKPPADIAPSETRSPKPWKLRNPSPKPWTLRNPKVLRKIENERTLQSQVPWRNWEEWLEVSKLIMDDNQDSQLRAVEIIRIWETRGCCPIAVTVTAQLLSDKLFVTKGGEEEQRLRLSMIIVRFVNGVTDLIQKGKYHQSIGILAKASDIPVNIVDVRHAATHRRLPSMRQLRRAIVDAEKWLQKYYWKAQADKLQMRWKKILRLLREINKAKSEQDNGAVKRVISKLISKTRPSTVVEVLVPTLIQHFLARPPVRAIKLSRKTMTGIFLKQLKRWATVLRKFGERWPVFIPALVHQALRRAKRAGRWEKGLLALWCTHFLQEKEGFLPTKASRELLFSKMYDVCVGDKTRTPWLETCLVNSVHDYSGLSREQKVNLLRLQDLATPTAAFVPSEHTASMTLENALDNLRDLKNRMCDVEQNREPWQVCRKFHGRAIGHIKH